LIFQTQNVLENSSMIDDEIRKEIATFLLLLKETSKARRSLQSKLDRLGFSQQYSKNSAWKRKQSRSIQDINQACSNTYQSTQKIREDIRLQKCPLPRKALQTETRKSSPKTRNPRIKQIHFNTLRHWKATMEYAKTKDLLHVKQFLGHKKFENTKIYSTDKLWIRWIRLQSSKGISRSSATRRSRFPIRVYDDGKRYAF
jgi:hypothetical protein